MGLIMTPTSVGSDGTVNSYVVALPAGAAAVLNLVPGRGWDLTVRPGGGAIDDRGLFASTKDIILKLEAEFNSTTGPGWPQAERRSRPRA
jgi:hypothetical protein